MTGRFTGWFTGATGRTSELILPLREGHGRLRWRMLRDDLAVDDSSWRGNRGRLPCSHHTAADGFDAAHTADRRSFDFAGCTATTLRATGRAFTNVSRETAVTLVWLT